MWQDNAEQNEDVEPVSTFSRDDSFCSCLCLALVRTMNMFSKGRFLLGTVVVCQIFATPMSRVANVLGVFDLK